RDRRQQRTCRRAYQATLRAWLPARAHGVVQARGAHAIAAAQRAEGRALDRLPALGAAVGIRGRSGGLRGEARTLPGDALDEALTERRADQVGPALVDVARGRVRHRPPALSLGLLRAHAARPSRKRRARGTWTSGEPRKMVDAASEPDPSNSCTAISAVSSKVTRMRGPA